MNLKAWRPLRQPTTFPRATVLGWIFISELVEHKESCRRERRSYLPTVLNPKKELGFFRVCDWEGYFVWPSSTSWSNVSYMWCIANTHIPYRQADIASSIARTQGSIYSLGNHLLPSSSSGIVDFITRVLYWMKLHCFQLAKHCHVFHASVREGKFSILAYRGISHQIAGSDNRPV